MPLLRRLVASAAVLAATSVLAQDWAPFPGNEHRPAMGFPSEYLDRDSIKSSGEYQQVWYLRDKPGKGSEKLLWEIDCTQRKSRLLGFAVSKDQMGKGELVDRSDPNRKGGWGPLVWRGEEEAFVLKEVCQRPAFNRMAILVIAGVALALGAFLLWRRLGGRKVP